MKRILTGLLTAVLLISMGCTADTDNKMSQEEIKTYLQQLVEDHHSAKIETERKESLNLPDKRMNKELYMSSEYVQEPFQIHLKVSGIDGIEPSDAEIYSYVDVAYERLTIDPKTWQKTDPLVGFVQHNDYVKFEDIHGVMLDHAQKLNAVKEQGQVSLRADLSKSDAQTSAGELIFIAYPSLLIELQNIQVFQVEAVFDEASKQPVRYAYRLEADVVVDGQPGKIMLDTKATISMLDGIDKIEVPQDILDRIQ